MIDLQTIIDRFGEELVMCTDNLDQNAGVLPRGLHLERPGATGRGCFAIGQNPGRLSSSERRFFRDSGATYASVKEFYAKELSPRSLDYFKRVRRIIDQLGLVGPIIWSNLAKCENAKEREGLPPIQTIRHCTSRFLLRELKAFPNDWPVLAIGWHSFVVLAHLAPKVAVVGIPHPTGGGGVGFRKMLDNLDNEVLRRELKDRAEEALSATEQKAVWLGSKKQDA